MSKTISLLCFCCKTLVIREKYINVIIKIKSDLMVNPISKIISLVLKFAMKENMKIIEQIII